ncbi:hypothetical protein L798_10795 [Zootermopsis nevadensis]|uniref:Uncharacterized protein n=1 Tax=Zootermopsis nevadensis TaxID=136037 RepID=A0A067RLK6_ZOONE|nr:hypothetical protein L798_10795 [Zootermopsis nevadensis]
MAVQTLCVLSSREIVMTACLYCNSGRPYYLVVTCFNCVLLVLRVTAEPNPKVTNIAEVFECHPDELSRTGGEVVAGTGISVFSCRSGFDNFPDSLPVSCVELIFNNGYVIEANMIFG